jgi:threonylcarbamoyladenosine tRNA methylthiotransferase MtaB
MKVLFTNLGCKVNQAESDQFAREFEAAGHTVVTDLTEADLHVVNSCTVTATAARDSRRAVRRAARSGALGVRTVLTGCYAAATPDATERLPGLDLVVLDKERLREHVEARFGVASRPAVPGPPRLAVDGGTRALLKIEDGCDVRCTFCVIPQTRGRQRSRPLAAVLADSRALLAAGHRELVVTGVQISAWREGNRRLADLVAALLASLPADGVRLRLSSIAPWQFEPRLLALWSDPRLCRHVHLAVQSGAAATLRRMRRPSHPERFVALVDALRATVPEIAITTDFIVGFPGETEPDFRESLDFVARLGFARVHVFPFSPRPDTPAAELPGLGAEVLRERMTRMLAVAASAEQAFQRAQVGRRARVLWERPRRGLGNGLTDTYQRVWSAEAAGLRNCLSEVEVVGCGAEGLIGRLVA